LITNILHDVILITNILHNVTLHSINSLDNDMLHNNIMDKICGVMLLYYMIYYIMLCYMIIQCTLYI